MEDINLKIDSLEKRRLAAYRENQKVKDKIRELQKKSQELYHEEFNLQDEITKIKTGSTKHFLGEYVKVCDKYIYVTSVTNEYNSSICAFGGPHFSLHKNCFGKGFYWFDMSTEHSSAHNNAVTYVESLDDVVIITKEDFIKAYDEYIELSKKYLVESINIKPIGKKENEYIFETDEEY